MSTPSLEQLADLAECAGRKILAIYATDFDVETKDDASPVTAADMAAHRCIVGGLTRLSPDIPVLSEESANIPWATRRAWDRYWLVDPLDGTKEFIKRNGEFTVNIALIEQGRAVASVVHAPVLDETFVASTQRGALWRQVNGAFTPISVRPVPARGATVAVSKSHRSPATQRFLDALGPHAPVAIGSSLKLCRIAQGRADAYPRLGPTSEWDIAAGQCVLEQAGGRVITADGKRLMYNEKESILNPEFLAIGDQEYPWPGLAG